MNDDARTGFTGESDFATEGDFSGDSEFEETSSFSPGPVRFMNQPDYSAEPGLPPEWADTVAPGNAPEAEDEPLADRWDAAEPADVAEPEAAAESAAYKPADIAEPRPFSAFEPFSGPRVTVDSDTSAEPEPEHRLRPQFPDAFGRPPFYAKPETPEEYRFPFPDLPRWSTWSPREEPRSSAPPAPQEPRVSTWPTLDQPRFTPRPRPAAEPPEPVPMRAVPDTETEPEAAAPKPAVTVEVPGKPAAQHPVRTTSELSVPRPPEPPAEIDPRPQDALWAYESYPLAQNVPLANDQAGVVSLGYIGAAIGRKKKVWILTTVLGILLAAGLYHSYHPTYSDSTTVLLALDPSLDPNTAIQTDAILADDSMVAQLTMSKLGIHESVPTFQKTYSVAVSTTSNNLLTFTATAGSATAAYNEANTLADTFLQYRAQTELEKESANTAGQVQQVTQTQQTISSIDSQISKLRADGALPGDSRLTRLQNELTTAQNLLTSLQQTVAGDEATQRSATAGLIAGSSVIDTGIPAEGHSKNRFALEYGGASIFGGLVLGLLIVAIGAVVSDKLRRRDDVAAALGAPVRLSVASGGRGRSRESDREADLNRVAAHLRSAVPSGSDGAGSIVVVAVDDKTFISEAIRQLAVTAAHEGKRVVLADLVGGTLGGLLGTRETGVRPVDVGGVRVALVTPDRGDLAPVGPLHAGSLGTPVNGVANVHAVADLFITLASVSPATGGAHLKTWADDAVAVITVGESSVVKVQAVGEMIRFAGVHLDSAILLGTDEKDESLGLVTA